VSEDGCAREQPTEALGPGKRGKISHARRQPKRASSFSHSWAVVNGCSDSFMALKMTDFAPSRSSPAAGLLSDHCRCLLDKSALSTALYSVLLESNDELRNCSISKTPELLLPQLKRAVQRRSADTTHQWTVGSCRVAAPTCRHTRTLTPAATPARTVCRKT